MTYKWVVVSIAAEKVFVTADNIIDACNKAVSTGNITDYSKIEYVFRLD